MFPQSRVKLQVSDAETRSCSILSARAMQLNHQHNFRVNKQTLKTQRSSSAALANAFTRSAVFHGTLHPSTTRNAGNNENMRSREDDNLLTPPTLDWTQWKVPSHR